MRYRNRVKISDLRAKVPLYGAAFDYAISTLQMAGLVRIVREGNEEYVKLTDLGNAPFPSFGFGIPRHRSAPYAVGPLPPSSGCHRSLPTGLGLGPTPSPALYLRKRDKA
jgi:hypothetical protein